MRSASEYPAWQRSFRSSPSMGKPCTWRREAVNIILIRLTDNVRDIMRNPEKVLNSLAEHSKNFGYKYERLYRILFNEEMYYVAYQKINSKPGNMTEGSNGKTIDRMSLTRIEKLIDSLKDESYQPQPSRRVYIPKKNGKMRPLGIPDFDDKLVQEVLRMILEAIYEGSFEQTSHGFRPKRSCHTALAQIQKTFSGAKWFVEGDIKGFFDNINHDVMIKILGERIIDNRFLRLIRKFMNAGYIDEWTFHKTYSGTPQGGIISPLLANIYLDKLDKYMNKFTQKFNKGTRRRINKKYDLLANQKYRAVKKLKSSKTTQEREIALERFKSIRKELLQTQYSDEMDNGFKRIQYVRYADDFLIGIIGSKEDGKTIKENIKEFLLNELALELSEDKTLITHSEKTAKFLGFDIFAHKTNQSQRDVIGRVRRAWSKRIALKMPADVIKRKLIEYDLVEIKTHNGKEQWKPKSRRAFTICDDLEILLKYNSELRGLYNYYSIAINSSSLNSFRYIMEYSMYKTFAHKYRTSVTAICKKYKHNGIFTVRYMTKSGKQSEMCFYNEGFRRKNPMAEAFMDTTPAKYMFMGRTSLIDRLKAQTCECCGADSILEIHHVRKMKDIKGKSKWAQHMIARRRKTIAVCLDCHQKIHDGKL